MASAERPTLSVIVPVYNMEKYVGKCLSTILSFNDASIEIIVVDDGSTDGTNAVLMSFSDKRLKVLATQRGGPSAARNAGFKCSRGRFILFFDADDIPVVENWHAVLAAFAAHPDAALIYGAERIFEGAADDFQRTPPKETYPHSDAVVPLIFKRNFMPMGSVFVRREVIEAAGLWNESLRHGEDWELWCRLACLGQFIHCPVLVTGWRRHTQSATGATVSHDAEDPGLAAIEVIYSHPSVRDRTGVHHDKLKQLALAWRSYYWGTTLMRSGATWPGLKAIGWAISRDSSILVLLMSNYPKRLLRQWTDRRASVTSRAGQFWIAKEMAELGVCVVATD